MQQTLNGGVRASYTFCNLKRHFFCQQVYKLKIIILVNKNKQVIVTNAL